MSLPPTFRRLAGACILVAVAVQVTTGSLISSILPGWDTYLGGVPHRRAFELALLCMPLAAFLLPLFLAARIQARSATALAGIAFSAWCLQSFTLPLQTPGLAAGLAIFWVLISRHMRAASCGGDVLAVRPPFDTGEAVSLGFIVFGAVGSLVGNAEVVRTTGWCAPASMTTDSLVVWGMYLLAGSQVFRVYRTSAPGFGRVVLGGLGVSSLMVGTSVWITPMAHCHVI